VAVLVVDNASSDGTPAEVAKHFGDSVTISRTGGNYGYAGGNNVGLRIAREAGAEFVVLVNPDARVSTSCVEDMVGALTSDPDVGLASPAICYAGSDIVWYGGSEVDLRSGSTYHSHEGDQVGELPAGSFDTGRASGCVMGLRIEVFNSIGGLDERYFLYYEETEWSLRMKGEGYRIIVVASARAWHDVGHGKGSATAGYHYYMTRNRLLLIAEYGPQGVGRALPRSLRDSFLTFIANAKNDPSGAGRSFRAITCGYVDFFRGRYGMRQSWIQINRLAKFLCRK
jgi:GT2 family glycosyltransferase